MSLFDDIKTSLRITTDKMDSEVQMLIDGALYDMWRVGVNPKLLELNADDDLDNPFVKHAVTAYCKSNFGFDLTEAMRFDESYRRIVCDLMNSSENIAAIELQEAEAEQHGEDAEGE